MVSLFDSVSKEIFESISKYRPMDEGDISLDSRLVDDLRVSGDDLSEIAYRLHKKFSIDQRAGDYSSVFTVRDWANLIVTEAENRRARLKD